MNDFQRNILDLEKVNPGTNVSNIGGMIVFSVEISYEQFTAIISEIIYKTNEIRLRLGKNNELYEYKEEMYIIPYIYVDGGYEQLLKRAEHFLRVPFDIYDNDLFEFAFAEYKDGKAGFLKLHHLLGDAASIALLCKNIEKGYFSVINNNSFLCERVETVYSELTEVRINSAIKYFEKRLSVIPKNRITDKKTMDYSADIMKFTVELKHKNMFSEFLAVLYIYISAITDSKKVIIGNVLGNRSKKEFNMFGMFANTLPFVMEFNDEIFMDLCGKIESELFLLMKYSGYSLRALRRHNNINENPFDISVSYKISRFIPRIKIGDVIEIFNGCCDCPIRIFAEEYDDRLDFNIHYKNKLFSKKEIKNIGSFIASVLIQDNRYKKISEISVLSEYDKKIYKSLNNTYRKHKYIDVIECFKEHISDNEAVVFGDSSINGFELDEKSDYIAAYLHKRKARIVGIRTERCIEMIIAVIGALKSGAAFMIISDSIPDMEAECDVILTENDIINTEKNIFEIPIYNPEDTAYLIYTSGSSGKPKCVEISRRSLMSRLEWAEKKFGLKGNILQKTINTFDVSVWEMLSVIYGARLCLLKSGDEKFPDRIAKAITKYSIERLHFVPSMLNVFIKHAKLKKLKFPTVKAVFSSGEKLEKYMTDNFYEVFNAELYNLYGPSECSIDVTAYRCVKGEKDIPIGTPADNTQIYIINSINKVLPIDICGEICVTGELVGKGYTNGERGGFFEFKGKKAYRTGDIGKIGFDGNLYIYGRNDSQIKIRGMRINISEIKNAVSACKNVTDTAIVKNGGILECFYSGEADIEDIKKSINGKLPSYAVPSLFCKISEIPLTKSGKADLKVLSAKKMLEIKNNEKLNQTEEVILHTVQKYIKANAFENLFDKGLDSITILEIVCELEEKGINITFGDFYEGLSVKETAGLIKDRKYIEHIVWLKRENHEKLLVCFPYAGGEPQFFSKLAKKLDCDTVGIYISSFDAKDSIESIAKKLFSVLPLNQYKEIYVYGHCIGCMAAIEFSVMLSDKISGIILAAPALSRAVPFIGSPWNMISDENIKKVLADSENKRYSKSAVLKFRKDTNRYFKYMNEHKKRRLDCKAMIVFGTDDVFTKNIKKIIKKLKKILSGEIQSCFIENGKHFFTETHTFEVYELISAFIK